MLKQQLNGPNRVGHSGIKNVATQQKKKKQENLTTFSCFGLSVKEKKSFSASASAAAEEPEQDTI